MIGAADHVHAYSNPPHHQHFQSGIGAMTPTHLTVGWKPNASGRMRMPEPPRSGHVAFTVGTDMYVFGGYGEEQEQEQEQEQMKRYPMNDLWKRSISSRSSDAHWERVEQVDPPQERLVSAVSVLNGKPYLFGGWNPNNREKGENEILDTVHVLDTNIESTSTSSHHPNKKVQWRELPVKFPDGPTSRHVALTLPCNTKALIHNHRCGIDHVYVFDATTESFVRQATKAKDIDMGSDKGEMEIQAPNGIGLHAACMLGSFALFFGGADKMQGMINESYLLNTITWEWSKVKIEMDGFEDDDDEHDAIPCPRAAPCVVSFNETSAILYGGAKVGNMGLEPLDDVWALYVNRFDATGKWERLAASSSEMSTEETRDELSLSSESSLTTTLPVVVPPGRNAATLCEMDMNMGTLTSTVQTKQFLLHGGWSPFRQTWNDDYILHVLDPGRER